MDIGNFSEDQIFMFRLMTSDSFEAMEGEPELGTSVTMKCMFGGSNQDKKFHITITPMNNPIGIEVKGFGSAPPNVINDAVIGYVMNEILGQNLSPVVAVGELMHMMCLHFAAHYYIKLPYNGDDSRSTRWWIQPCGFPGDRHYHIIELDDVTKKPIDLMRDMDHDTTHPTLGQALSAITESHFQAFHDDLKRDDVQEAVKELLKQNKKDTRDKTLQQKVDDVLDRKAAKKEREEDVTTEIPDVFRTAWNDDAE